MANRSRLSIAKPQIEKLFDTTYNHRVYSQNDLRVIFNVNSKEWRLAKTTTLKDFIRFLISRSRLKLIRLEFPRPTIRFIWGEVQPDIVFELCNSLDSKAYLSHYTAMFLHNLTEQIPKNIYVTIEQSAKDRDGELTQEDINEAFKKPIRRSQDIAVFSNYKITRLQGAFTGNLGITRITGETGGSEIRVTNIERTLIDIAVRPEYSGGVLEVIKAYELAKERCQTNTLRAYIKKMHFVYPYHQVIGFYLEKAGYPENKLKTFDDFEKNYDFFLYHNMDEMSYSERWRLYYPKSLGN